MWFAKQGWDGRGVGSAWFCLVLYGMEFNGMVHCRVSGLQRKAKPGWDCTLKGGWFAMKSKAKNGWDATLNSMY